MGETEPRRSGTVIQDKPEPPLTPSQARPSPGEVSTGLASSPSARSDCGLELRPKQNAVSEGMSAGSAVDLVVPMIVLIVLLVSRFAFRVAGWAGVAALASWQASARYALVVMFVFAATAHFNKMKHDLARTVPSYFPRPLLLVYITGVLELLGAAGLMLPEFRRTAAYCLIALLIGMFVANVNAAQKGVTLRGKPATPLWLRTPMQLLFVALLWWSSR